MATIKTHGDLITLIQGQSKTGVTYSVQASTFVPGGFDVLKNGVRTWSYIFHATPGGSDLTGAASDANPTGHVLQLVDASGVPVKADAQLFINSLN